jgi:hypothetical protein
VWGQSRVSGAHLSKRAARELVYSFTGASRPQESSRRHTQRYSNQLADCCGDGLLCVGSGPSRVTERHTAPTHDTMPAWHTHTHTHTHTHATTREKEEDSEEGQEEGKEEREKRREREKGDECCNCDAQRRRGTSQRRLDHTHEREPGVGVLEHESHGADDAKSREGEPRRCLGRHRSLCSNTDRDVTGCRGE